MVTQEQIAKKLGVSRQLVTFALAGYPQVSKESRERILAVAAEMGYRPNPHARALKGARTQIIALWIPDQISTHYNHVARELNHLVKSTGQELIISEVGAGHVEQLLAHVPVDAVIAVDAPDQVRAHLKSTYGKRTPVVSAGAGCCEETDCVKIDLRTGTAQLMSHLIGNGYRRIAHATFVRKDSPQTIRRIGYAQAMCQAGLKPEFIYYPLEELQRPVTRRLIQDYIRKHGAPEAIFCHSDDAALGVYRGLLDMGLRVPADVALAGCDGIQDTEYLERPLTTLVQPVAAMCATAWQFLLQRLERPRMKRQQTVLRAELVVRDSSKSKI